MMKVPRVDVHRATLLAVVGATIQMSVAPAVEHMRAIATLAWPSAAEALELNLLRRAGTSDRLGHASAIADDHLGRNTVC